MRCVHCGVENAVGMRFCGQCGRPLPLGCASCGRSNPADQKFCGHCGARLHGGTGLRDSGLPEPYRPGPQTSAATGPVPGEMKQVTVLFCDIVANRAGDHPVARP